MREESKGFKIIDMWRAALYTEECRISIRETYSVKAGTRLILFRIEMVHFRPKGFGGFPPYIVHRLIAHTLGHYYGHILLGYLYIHG